MKSSFKGLENTARWFFFYSMLHAFTKKTVTNIEVFLHITVLDIFSLWYPPQNWYIHRANLHVDHVHISHFLNVVSDRGRHCDCLLYCWLVFMDCWQHAQVSSIVSLWCHVVLSFLISMSPFFIILWKLDMPFLLGFTGLPTSCQYSLCPLSRWGSRKLTWVVTFLVLRETCLMALTFKIHWCCQSVRSSVHFRFIPPKMRHQHKSSRKIYHHH